MLSGVIKATSTLEKKLKMRQIVHFYIAAAKRGEHLGSTLSGFEFKSTSAEDQRNAGIGHTAKRIRGPMSLLPHASLSSGFTFNSTKTDDIPTSQTTQVCVCA